MRFQQVLQRVYGEPWMITKPGWYAIHQLVSAHFERAAEVTERFKVPDAAPQSKRPAKGFFGEIDQFRVVQGVAVVPIKGSIVKGASMFEKACGACSHEDLHEDLDQIEAMGIERVLLDVNSPGGMVMGTPEVARRIARLKANGVKTFSFTDELNCSAAYQMSCGVGKMMATPSSWVGSIGTIWEFENVSAWLEKMGIRYEVFTSGKFKGMGHPGKELTEEQRDWIQGHVNHLAEQFKDHVREHRARVREETMEGQSFTGEQAKDAGLIDELVGGFNEALEIARRS